MHFQQYYAFNHSSALRIPVRTTLTQEEQDRVSPIATGTRKNITSVKALKLC
jgi:hypothetical protein